MYEYSIYLPLYDDVSTYFKSFIRETSALKQVRYYVEFRHDRLTFSPFANGDVEKNKRVSISAKALTPDCSQSKKLVISKFATKFNMLTSIAYSNMKKCLMTMELIPAEEDSELFCTLVVHLITSDLAVSMAIDNLWCVLN